MNRHINPEDLCINCLHADECTFCGHQSSPVIFCEEFTCDEPSASLTNIDSISEIRIVPVDSRSVEVCCNCMSTDFCSLNKTNGKLVHCEEYQ